MSLHMGSSGKPVRLQPESELGSEIGTLMQKVNMDNAFLNLAKNDSELVDEMKKAITRLTSQAQRREILCIAIEHNTKYLTALFQQCEIDKNAAQLDASTCKQKYQELKKETDENNRKMKGLLKDSE